MRDSNMIPLRFREWILSSRLRPIIYMGMIAGVMHGLGPGKVPVFGLLNGLFVMGLLMLWRRVNARYDASFADLLPHGRELYLLGGILLLYFILFGLKMRPEALPGIGPQATIWLCYVFFIWLTLRNSRNPLPSSLPEIRRILPIHMLVFSLAMVIVAAISGLLPQPAHIGLYLLTAIVGWGVGLVFFYKALREVRL